MYHSIIFGDKNTWDDWHIIPASRPVFSVPQLKSRVIDIPGGNGNLDFSTALTGYPVFQNREGSFEFIVENGYGEWFDRYSVILAYLHGKYMRAVLEDEPDYFYEGRFTVNEWRSEKDWSRITVDYSVKPYKYYIHTSLEDWIWDTFNFQTGVISDGKFNDISVLSGSGWTTRTFMSKDYGTAPVTPEFIVSTPLNAGIQIRLVCPDTGLNVVETFLNGEWTSPKFVFYGSRVLLYFKCVNESETGTVSINFRKGKL